MSTCGKCGAPALYTRRYSGEVLCAGCFKESVVEKTWRALTRNRMIARGDLVGVGVSGGKDSLSLLKVLHGLEDRHGARVIAISVDEGVEGYRDEAIAHARAVAQGLGIEHLVVSYRELFGFSLDEALGTDRSRDVSACSLCGVFRRRAIDEAAARASVSVVATAHNLDDFVQTFLMNLFHGDTERLAWLDPAYSGEAFPMRRVKPFMWLYEEEIALYAYLEGLPFQSVSCPYMHEGLRSDVRDYLNEMEAKRPGMKNVLMGSALEVISRYKGESGKKPVPCAQCGRPSTGGRCSVCRLTEQLKQRAARSG